MVALGARPVKRGNSGRDRRPSPRRRLLFLSMPSTEWTGFALTALGGVLAAGGGWLNDWGQSKRERQREERTLRLQSFVELLYVGDVLGAALALRGRQIVDAIESGDNLEKLPSIISR